MIIPVEPIFKKLIPANYLAAQKDERDQIELASMNESGVNTEKSSKILKPEKVLAHLIHCHAQGQKLLDPYTNDEQSYILWLAVEELMLVCYGKTDRYDPNYESDKMRALIRPHLKMLHRMGHITFIGFRIRERHYYGKMERFLECGIMVHTARILESLQDVAAGFDFSTKQRIVNKAHWIYLDHENFSLMRWLLIEACFPGVKKYHKMSVRNGTDIYSREDNSVGSYTRHKSEFFLKREDSPLFLALKEGLGSEGLAARISEWLSKTKYTAKDSIALKKVDVEWFSTVTSVILLYELVNSGEGAYNIYNQFKPK